MKVSILIALEKKLNVFLKILEMEKSGEIAQDLPIDSLVTEHVFSHLCVNEIHKTKLQLIVQLPGGNGLICMSTKIHHSYHSVLKLQKCAYMTCI